jgi:tetratricopeptide (TPR) repeat protein
VVRANPAHVQANLLLGAHYQRRGQLSLAIQHLDAALKAGPPRDDLKLKLADLNGQVGRVDDAIILAREVVAARPTLAAAHYVLGSLYLNKGSVPQAVEALGAAARLAPDNAVTQLTLASAHERAGQADRAVAIYKRVQALTPDDPRPYNNAAWLNAVQGKNLDEALAQARRAVELTRRSPALAAGLAGVLDTLGFVHYRRREFAQAEPLFRQAAELATGQVTVQYHLGLTYHRLGRKDEAATWLRRSLQGGGRFPEADEARRLLAELGG